MDKVPKINFREIKRISPSQFYSMKNCAYKSLLAEAFGKNPLLPLSPNAYFGTVLHKILELIAKGVVKSEDDFSQMFDIQVKAVEDNLKEQGYNFFVPLQRNVKDFGMKKILLKKHLMAVSEEPAKPSNVKYNSEKWYESKDKLIAGKIDLVIEGENTSELIDFKTGAITEDILDDTGEVFVEVKEGYKEQLKLYAWLYYENTGKFPTSLSLVDLAKQKFPVSFSESECISLYEEAKELLHSTNESINNGTFAANPSEANCRYCLYRPACSFFQKQIETDYIFNDVLGSVSNLVRYQNGNVNLFLQNGGRQITITNINSDKYDELNSIRDKKISIYNLRKEASDYIYSATKTTIMYD